MVEVRRSVSMLVMYPYDLFQAQPNNNETKQS